MPLRTRPHRRLLLGAVLALVLGALLGTPISALADAGVRPKVGQCHQLSQRQAYADDDARPAVPCTRRHNLQTVAVVTSPQSLAGLTSEQLSDLGATLCLAAGDRALGRSTILRHQSAYSMWTFAPTAAQIAAGAHWFRCDLGLQSSGRPLALPQRRLPHPVLRSPIPDSQRRCLTRPGWVTPCTHAHAWRSTGAFVLQQSTYPTADDVTPMARGRCPSGWDQARWPTEWAWSKGDRVVVCYDETKK